MAGFFVSRRLLLFDLDGTLVNSEAIILEAQRRAFASLGMEPRPREVALSIVGLSLPEAFTVLAGENGPVEALCTAYREAFFALRTEGGDLEHLFPGASALIAELRRDPALCLGIATGKSQRGVRAIIDTYGWSGVFEAVQTSDDAPSKPHPGMIQNAMASTRIIAAHTVMIGDSSFDMRMAKAAGVRAVGVAWGFQPVEALREAGADVIVEDFAALAGALSRFAR
jgi:phosphoglycolate phosphatase